MEKIYVFSETALKMTEGELEVVPGKAKVMNLLPATRTKKAMLDQIDEMMERRQVKMEKNGISYKRTDKAFAEPTSKGVVFLTYLVVGKGDNQVIHNGVVLELDCIDE